MKVEKDQIILLPVQINEKNNLLGAKISILGTAAGGYLGIGIGTSIKFQLDRFRF